MSEKTDPYRAGRYQRQSGGYSAFVPEALPPNPPIKFDEEMQTLLSRADRALGRLDGSIQTLPDPDLFVFMYVRKEAVLSSQIEGTQSSLDDLLQAEAKVMDARQPNDVGEVLNYVGAMNYGLERLKELPLSIRLIREIHHHLLRDVRGRERDPGEIRRSQNWIGPQGCMLREATFVPPPPHLLIDSLGALETFLHEDHNIPMLIKIGLVHAQFETIHPFLDGNGRVGRLLITFLLCQNEVLLRPVLYISHYFRRNRQEYYELLQRVRDIGDWESWLRFFLKGITEVSREATETARRIVDLRERHRGIITEKFGRGAGSALTVFETLFKHPIVTVSNVAETLQVTFPAANDLVRRFVDEGILMEMTGQARYRVFSYAPYIDLFTADRVENNGEAVLTTGSVEAAEQAEPSTEAPVVQTVYRASANSEIWHWWRNCSTWPIQQYRETTERPPNHSLCGECLTKESTGDCNAK
jgi:Fic family protein